MQDDPRHLATFRRVALFDVVVNNADRKSGHCLLAEDGDLFFVDHGVCFSVEPKLRTVIWAFAGEPITPAEGDDLRSFRSAMEQDQVRDRLASLVSPAEIGAVVGRVDTLLGTGRLPRPGPERPYPWPPV
jgi:uncharacterized repeat protein (TIGR03843 family)